MVLVDGAGHHRMVRDVRISDGPQPARQSIGNSTADVAKMVTHMYGVCKPVTVQVKSGKTYQGVFSSYAGEGRDGGSLVLQYAKQIKGENGQIPAKPDRHKTLIVQSRDLVLMKVEDVPNLNELRDANGSSSAFATDSEISRSRGRLAGRELQKWEPPPDVAEPGLEDMDSQRGQKWDQFATNERLYNVKSTFDENLYTTKLDIKKSAISLGEAERLASEILRAGASSGAHLNAHIAEERGMEVDDERTEEERFGSVLRIEPVVRAKPSSSLLTGAGGRERDGGPRPDKNGVSHRSQPWSGSGNQGPASERSSWIRDEPLPAAAKVPVPSTTTRSAPVDIVAPRNRGLAQLNSGKVPSPYGTPNTSVKSPPGMPKQIAALDLQTSGVKFTPEAYKSFNAFKEQKKSAGEDKLSSSSSSTRAAPRSKEGSFEDSKGVPAPAETKSLLTPAVSSASQKSSYSSGPADYRPSSGMPPSTSIVAAAGGTAVAAPPPLSSSAQSPQTAHVPAKTVQGAVKSKLNPLAKEWTPSTPAAKPAAPVPSPVPAPAPVGPMGPSTVAGNFPPSMAAGSSGGGGGGYYSMPPSGGPPMVGGPPGLRANLADSNVHSYTPPPPTRMGPPSHGNGKAHPRDIPKDFPPGFDNSQMMQYPQQPMPGLQHQMMHGWGGPFNPPQTSNGSFGMMMHGGGAPGMMGMRGPFPPIHQGQPQGYMPMGPGQFMGGPYGQPQMGMPGGGPRGPFMGMPGQGGPPQFMPMGMGMGPPMMAMPMPMDGPGRGERNHNGKPSP